MTEANTPWHSSARTHVGKVRSHNEDAILNLPERGLWAVADGMGGHAAGDYASRLIVESLAALPHSEDLDERAAQVCRCLDIVNERLREQARHRRERVIGSTVVVLLAAKRQALLIWAGDSRVYRYQPSDGAIARLSRDHSRVEELVDMGLITREQSETHPAANIITRAVGVADAVDFDVERVDVEEGDMFLLCSDGLYKEVAEAEMTQLLAGGDDKRACDLLLERTLERGARDNVSVIVVHQVPDATTLTRTRWNPSYSDAITDLDDPTKQT